MDYLLTAKSDRKAARRFLCKAINSNDEPTKINIDKSGAIIEQDHRPIKQLCRATLGFKRFRTARITIGGFESMRMIRKRQMEAEGNTSAEIQGPGKNAYNSIRH